LIARDLVDARRFQASPVCIGINTFIVQEGIR
jgi:hypothetical protein